MNTQLYNSLIKAKNYLITVKKNESAINEIEGLIQVAKVDYDRPVVKEDDNEPSLGLVLLFIVFLPFALIYLIYLLIKHFTDKKKSKQYEEYKNSPENIKKQQEREQYIEELKEKLDAKTKESTEYYSDNFWDCMGFLPDWLRQINTIDDVNNRIKYIDGLLHYVNQGAATLSEAQSLYASDLRELDELEKNREQKEISDRRHKEEMEALERISKNQEKTNDELDRIYRETFHKRF